MSDEIPETQLPPVPILVDGKKYQMESVILWVALEYFSKAPGLLSTEIAMHAVKALMKKLDYMQAHALAGAALAISSEALAHTSRLEDAIPNE